MWWELLPRTNLPKANRACRYFDFCRKIPLSDAYNHGHSLLQTDRNACSVFSTERCFWMCPFSGSHLGKGFEYCLTHFLYFYTRSQDYLLGVSGLLPWRRRGVKAVAAAARQHSREAVLIPHKSSCHLFGLVLPHGDPHRVGRHAQGDEWGDTGRCVTSDGVRQVYTAR